MNALEELLKTFPGVSEAHCSVVYGENNLFHIKAVVKAENADAEALKALAAEKLGAGSAPDIVEFE